MRIIIYCKNCRKLMVCYEPFFINILLLLGAMSFMLIPCSWKTIRHSKKQTNKQTNKPPPQQQRAKKKKKKIIFQVLDCLDSEFFVSGTWTPDSNCYSRFLELYSVFQSPGFRILLTKFSRISESGFPHTSAKMLLTCTYHFRTLHCWLHERRPFASFPADSLLSCRLTTHCRPF